MLLIMSDNQSWNHVGAYGDRVVKTPNIDAVAGEGARFTNAFCAAPSCTPARAALLTGQDIYRLKQGGNLWGTLPGEFTTYPDLLEESGYRIGYEGKGWGPGNFEAAGRTRNPGGDRYDSFGAFLEANQKTPEKPWHYWYSSKHPHRPFPVGSGIASGIAPDSIEVPPYLPDVPEVRNDIADYYAAIRLFDLEVKALLETLQESGNADNTIVIICSDNGWQMPRGLANLYDSGTRVPLIIKWAGHVRKGAVIEGLVNLNDLAPTLLEAAGIEIPARMTAVSIRALLEKDGASPRDFLVMARERHAFARKNGLGYPARAIRTGKFLYIRNLEKDRWPAGDPPLFGDVDAHMLHYPSPAKLYLLRNRQTAAVKPFFDLSFAMRPEEELYDLEEDPRQLKNVANEVRYLEAKQKLAGQLDRYLRETDDPRVTNGGIVWDTARYFQPRDFRPVPGQEAREALGLEESYDYLGN